MRALEIKEKVFGPFHPDVALSLKSRAKLLQEQVESSQGDLAFMGVDTYLGTCSSGCGGRVDLLYRLAL